MTVRIDRFDREVFAFNPSQLPQALPETIDVGVRRDGEPANARTFGLRPRRHRPHCCAADQCDELAPPDHSITSSARPISGSGMVRPRALAVFRLMINSTLVACWTGRSAGFSPLRIWAV